MSRARPRKTHGILMASSLTFAHCEHGTVYVRLHDAEGRVFAAGAMMVETAINAADNLTKEIEAAMKEAGGAAHAHGCAGEA